MKKTQARVALVIEPPTPDTEQLNHPCAVAVALNGYVRLMWKGEPPQLPHMITDMDGILWICHVDFHRRVIRVEKKLGCYGGGKATTLFEVTPEDFEKLCLPAKLVSGFEVTHEDFEKLYLPAKLVSG